MPRVTLNKNNFTAGEFSPRLHGRTDIDRYGNALRTCVNAYPVVHGGAKRRGGSRFVKATKISAKVSRLIPFVFSRDDAYQLEFGDSYVRVLKAGGVDLGIELPTPYSDTMLADIDYAQGADTMFLFHPDVPIQRLRRFSDAYFDLSAAPFTTTPFAEQGHRLPADITLSAATVGTGRLANASAGVFLASDVGRSIVCDAGLAIVTAFNSTVQVVVNISIAFAGTALPNGTWYLDLSPQSTVTPSADSPVGALITLTADIDSWRNSQDVGRFVRINGGTAVVIGTTSALIANARIVSELDSAVAAPPLAWSLDDSVWNAANGYPRTGTLHEQRLVVGGSRKYPQTIWGSRTGEYFDYTLGTNDDDAYSFTIAADEINPISYLASTHTLIAHTYGGEFSLQGGIEKPITPTNVRIKPESPHGSKGVRPIGVGKESIFVQRSGRKVRALGYRDELAGYAAPDLTVLAEHITELGGITQMAYQQEPDMLIWATRTDGALLSCTFDREQSVIAWAPHYTEGAFESVSCIPNGDQDETWLVVRRTVNGTTVRYIEIFDDTFEPRAAAAAPEFPPAAPATVYGFTVDCGLAIDSGGADTFSVPHLIGKTVDIVADGAVMPQQVVPPSGQIVLTRNAFRVLVGLHFRTEIGLLTPELGTAEGTAQGNSMRTSEVTVRFLDTIGAQVYDGDGDLVEDLSFREFGLGVLDQAPRLFSGLKRAEKLGWERGSDEISIVQDQPLPMHVLAVIQKFQTNSG